MLNINGLPNLSNTCYLNSTLQALNNCKYFDYFVNNLSGDLNFKSMLNEPNHKNRLILYKKFVLNLQNILPKYFNVLEQNDVQEFLMLYIDIFYEKVKMNNNSIMSDNILMKQCEKKWNTNYSPIQEIFYYQTIRQVQCANCLKKNINIETSNTICIEPDIDINTAIDNYFQSYYQNDWTCDKCNISSKKNRVSTYITRLPKIFIICIKRFGTQSNRNLNNIPLLIDFEKFTIKSSNTRYSLISTIEHVGSSNFGHYYTKLLLNDVVYEIDDETINKNSSNLINDKNTYILFYQQINH